MAVPPHRTPPSPPMIRPDDIGAVLPLKALARAKSRLAWPADERDRLVRGLIARALDALAQAGVRQRFVASRDAMLDVELAEEDVERLDFEADVNLNAAVREAARELSARRLPAMLMLSSDLPLLTPADVRALLAAAGPGIAVIARAHDGGTNGLVLPLPAAMGFAFAADGHSAERHAALARAAGLRPVVVDREGLARDLDTPADLARFGFATPGALGALLHA